MDFDAYARRLWAGRADAYEHGFARLTVHAVGPLLDAAGVGTGTRVLDVGTGPGVVAGAAAARGARVTAVDAEPSMAEAAARNVPGLDVRVAVLPDLPLPDAGFDAVTGNFVIHATGDPAAVLAELRRVLRAGGRLALTCWSEPPPPVLGIAREALEAAGVSWPPDIPVPPFRPHSSSGHASCFQYDECGQEPLRRLAGVPEALGVLNEQHITRPERAGLPARGDLDTAGDADDQLAPLLRLLSVASPGRAAAEQHRGGLPGLGDAHRIRRRIVRGEGNLDILEPSMTILVGEQAGNWDHARHDDTRRDTLPRGQVAEGAQLQVAAHVSGTRG